jgi:invasion protein IalB
MFKNNFVAIATTAAILTAGALGKPATPPAATDIAAPSAAAPPAGSVETKTFGDWAVRCFAIKGPVQCDMFQATVEKSSQRRIVSVSLAYAPRDNLYVAKFIVPLGAKVQDGLTIVTDKRANKPVAFSRCEQDGCYAEGPLNKAIVDKLLAAKAASLNIGTYGGPGLSLPISLNGFADALGAMKVLAAQRAMPS